MPRQFFGEALLLGGNRMSGSAAPETDGSSDDRGAQRALALLSEALGILDAHEYPPEIGARLQEVISALEAEKSAPS